MNILDEKMILSINTALRKEKIDVQTLLKDISMEDFLSKLHAHSVESLVYTAISDPHNLNNINKESANQWKKSTIFSTLLQEKHITQVENFFKVCNEKNIPVIALKGLLLRRLYPIPNTRTMSDADVLVHKEDLDVIRIILKQLGYIEKLESSHSDHHLIFSQPNYFNIEVHWTLNTNLTNRNIQAWETQIWNRCIAIHLNNTPVLSLSLEDHLIFLCLHMLSHIKYYGFGIRQLSDFYLFIEHYNSRLNWSQINFLIKELNISNFFLYIMSTCQTLFYMPFPHSYVPIKKISSAHLNYFIDTLLQGGVYGLNNKVHNATITMSHMGNNSYFKSIFRIIFPNKKRLSKHYSYLNLYPYLYPIVWIQNLWRLLTNDDFCLYQKLSIALLSSRAFRQRNRLLKELNS